ncbi:MAG TPA: LysR family transcriptional regulator [Ramlibacter sp.]|nr:LysR family transcriptional regulator [Ramlibacter sp.]
MKHFDPVSLRLFIAVCEEQSITLAGEREAIAPSAVSKRLAALEEQVGSPLMERGRRGIELTEPGKALLAGAREVLQSMARLQAELSEYAHGVHGHVRVAASPSAIAEFLPADLAAFLAQYESVRVSLEERLTPEVVRSVEDGRSDIGICWDAAGVRGLQSIPYRADRLVLVAHRDHALARRRQVSFAETLEYEHVAVNQGSIVQLTQQRRAAAAGEVLRYRVEVTTFDAACRIAAANLAVAIVPHEASKPFVKTFGLRAIALSDDWAQRLFVICIQDRARLTVPARLLVDALAAQWHGAGAHRAQEDEAP